MKIHLDKIETSKKITALGLKKTVAAEHYKECYYDTELQMYILIRKDDEAKDSKYSGKIMLERGCVAASQVSPESVPKHQAIGTPSTHDTPSGQKKKNKNTTATSKSALAEKIEQRAAAKDQ